MAIAPGVGAKEDSVIAEKKKLALAYLSEAWDDAAADGVDSEILAQAALFTALADLVTTYGEKPVADFAEALPDRIMALEFSVNPKVQ